MDYCAYNFTVTEIMVAMREIMYDDLQKVDKSDYYRAVELNRKLPLKCSVNSKLRDLFL